MTKAVYDHHYVIINFPPTMGYVHRKVFERACVGSAHASNKLLCPSSLPKLTCNTLGSYSFSEQFQIWVEQQFNQYIVNYPRGGVIQSRYRTRGLGLWTKIARSWTKN